MLCFKQRWRHTTRWLLVRDQLTRDVLRVRAPSCDQRTSRWMINIVAQSLSEARRITMKSLLLSPHRCPYTPHAGATCPMSGPVTLGNKSHVKCLSWTRTELRRIMISISQSTISAFRIHRTDRGILENEGESSSHAFLSDYITHHGGFLITI